MIFARGVCLSLGFGLTIGGSFQVDNWLNKEKGEHHSQETKERLDAAIGENRMLKSNLSDTQTNIALLKAELNQTRSQYETKCSELSM